MVDVPGHPETIDQLSELSMQSDDFKTQITGMFPKVEPTSGFSNHPPSRGRDSISSGDCTGSQEGNGESDIDDIETVEYYPGRTPMSSAFHAELGLLKALRKPRKEFGVSGKAISRSKAHSSVPWLTAEENLKASLHTTDYLSMSKKDLECLRRNPEDEKNLRERGQDIAAVRSLTTSVQFDPPSPNNDTTSRVHVTTKSRQIRHDQALEEFRQTILDISEDIELQVITAGRDLRDRLAEYDHDLDLKMKEIEKDSILRQQEYVYLINSWEELATLCSNRKGAIKDFSKKIGSFEKQRAQKVGENMKVLIDDMVLIGYHLRSEVQRLVEKEAHEVNLVIIENLKALADLEARMLKEQVTVYFKLRLGWESRETRWRELRHERALLEWEELIHSKRFTNPKQRIQMIEVLKSEQLERHTIARCPLLHELRDMVPPENFSTKDIERIHGELTKLYKTEVDANDSYVNLLRQLEEQLKSEMEEEREKLRVELHRYSALTEKGDLYTGGLRGGGSGHGKHLQTMISDPELDEFFRRAGGLKHELSSFCKVLSEPNLIYESHLTRLRDRVNVFVNAAKIENILHRQGKLEDKKGIEYTLEKLRTSKKAQLAPLVPMLFRQTKALCQIKGLSPDVCEELMDGMKLLQEVHPSFEFSLDVDDHKSVASGESARGTDPANITAGGDLELQSSLQRNMDTVVAKDVPNIPPVESEKPSESSENITKAAEVAYKEKQLSLVELRQAQRKIGAIVKASDLPGTIKAELIMLKGTLAQQEQSNELIDVVIANNCFGPIQQRVEELEQLTSELQHALSYQAEKVYHQQNQICEFYKSVANKVSQAVQREDATDLFFDKALDDLYDRFEEKDKTLEAEFAKAAHDTRHAPNEAALHSNMERALNILEQIKQSYRDYHKQGEHLANQHPERALEEACEFVSTICESFHLEAEPLTLDGWTQDGDNIDDAICDKLPPAHSPLSRPKSQESSRPQTASSTVKGETGKTLGEVRYKLTSNDNNNSNEQGELQDPRGTDRSPIVAAGGTIFQQKLSAAEFAEQLLRTVHPQSTDAQSVSSESQSDEASWAEDESMTNGNADGLSVTSGKVDENSNDNNVELVARDEEPISNMEEETSNTNVDRDVATSDSKENQDSTDAIAPAVDESSESNEQQDPVLPSDNDVEVNESNPSDPQPGSNEQPEDAIVPSESMTTVLPESVGPAGDTQPVEDVQTPHTSKARVARTRKPSLECGNTNQQIISMKSTVPCDEDGNQCITLVVVEPSLLTSMLLRLRESVLECMDTRHKVRLMEMLDIRAERRQGYTEELEEKLRLHWPRKGRTDVKYQQPRYGELLQHQQRHDRHIRAIKLKAKSQDERFNTLLVDAVKRCEVFKERLKLCSRHLEIQTTLAALQGTYKRGKDSLLAYRKEAKLARETLKAFVKSEPNSLLDMNRIFLDTCITFDAGGDYNEDELALEKVALGKVNETVSQVIAERAEKLHNVVSQQKEAQNQFKEFQLDFERCLQSLSMREGLGQKFGAPRRNIQDRLRSEILQCDSAATRIDRLIASLKKLLSINPGTFDGCSNIEVLIQQPLTSSQPSYNDSNSLEIGSSIQDAAGVGRQRRRSSTRPVVMEPHRNSLTVKIQQCLDSIRKCFVRRGTYLEFLRNPQLFESIDDAMNVEVYDPSGYLLHKLAEMKQTNKTLEDTDVESDPDHHAENKLSIDNVCVEGTFEYNELPKQLQIPVMNDSDVSFAMFADETHTFRKTIHEAEKACIEETKALFNADGNIGELGPNGIPESLELFLVDLRKRAEDHRNESAAKFRQQVATVEELLVSLPSVVLEDIVKSSEKVVQVLQSNLRVELDANKKHCDEIRAKHMQLLRPRLGEPDNRAELDELCRKEKRRQNQIHEGIEKARLLSLSAIKDQFEECIRCLLSTSRELIQRVCSTVMLRDLCALPGDDQLVCARKGLKRLKRQMVKRVAMELERAQLEQQTDSESADPSNKVTSNDDVPPAQVWGGVDLTKFVELSTELKLQNRDLKVGGEQLINTDKSEMNKVVNSGDIKAYSIVQVRTVILVRNRLYKSSILEFEALLRDAIDNFEKLSQSEKVADKSWEHMVEFLVKDTDEADIKG